MTASATALAPTSGPVGTTGVTINANGFIASHALTVTVGGTAATVTAGGTTGTNGSTTVTFTIPAAPNGPQAVVVSDGTNSATSGSNFTIQQSVTGLSPTTGTIGSSASITANGFIASHVLTVTVGGTSATITAGATSGTNGSSAITFTIPAVPSGTQAVVVSDGTNSATSGTNFTVAASATGLAPTSGNVGTTGVTINANGFIASHTLTVTVGGNSATITAGGTTGTNGSTTVTFTIPAAPNGGRTVVVSDGTNSATSATNFTITAAATGLNPTSGAVGTTGVTINASGFVASHALTVTVGATSATVTSGGTSDANGSSTITFTIPARPHGGQAVVVSDGTNSATSGTNFSVTSSITLSPTSGAVGSTDTITGTGFAATSTLTATFGGTAITLSPTTSGANGSFSATFTVPSKVNGSYTVSVTDGASNNATASYTIHTFSFVVTAPASATAGQSFNVSITAQVDGATDASYTGTHTITFSGPGNSPGGSAPTYPTSVSFTNGVASTVPITLVNAETVKLSATDGTYSGQSANITVSAAAASVMKLVNCLVRGSSVSCGGPFNLGNGGGTMQANISVTDAFGNTPANTSLTINLSSDNTGQFSVTSSVTITSSTTSTQLTVTKIGNAAGTANITAHATTGSYSDLVWSVSK